ncbi:protein kinase domain-containing protein [Kitasatospora sp. NPDC004240]
MEIGSLVGGRYRIESGWGAVWFAHDTGSGQPVVVRILARTPGPAARLRHPGIVTVLEVGEHEGRPFLAMERLDGLTLDDHLLDGGFRPAQVAGFGAQIAQALVVAHRAGMTYGAIDPADLMLTPSGAVKILGFGTAAPAHRCDLAALGDTMDQLLGLPVPPGSLGELGTLIAQLREAPCEQDPQLTEEFAARLRRLAQELTEARPVEPLEPLAERPRRPVVARPSWIHRRPGRRVQIVLVVVMCAALSAVTAYAIAVTV